MKKMVLPSLAVAVLALSAGAETFQIDPAHSKVGFRVKHMGISTVSGRFDKFSGTFDYKEGDPKSWKAQAAIDAASINTDNPRRDGHLRSADFFDAANCSTITFVSTGVSDVKGDQAKLHGKLTMHCVTKEVVLDLEIGGVTEGPDGLKHAGASATGTVDRTEFGLKWNKPLAKTAGMMVGDKVQISIDVEGAAQ